MGFVLRLTGYDLTDEGPGRTVNEDATLVRPDLGLFALADGAGGRGRGDVAANLALRSIENYIGSTVRRSHERPDYDILGNHEQAKRLSAAIHQAHQNILEVIAADPGRAGMATTVVAALMAPRTNQVHIAQVGDSRCYRIRNGRLELLTVDDTIATDILELRPDTSDEILERLPRNSVVRALGMEQELRVKVSTHDLFPFDLFLLCSDGLTTYVGTQTLWEVMRDGDPPSVIASELLNHALAARSQDNIAVVVFECEEESLDDAVETRRYAEVTAKKPSTPPETEGDDAPNSAELNGPEVLAGGILEHLEPNVEPVEDWSAESDYPTLPLAKDKFKDLRFPINESSRHNFSPELVEPPPISLSNRPSEEESGSDPYSIGPEDFEVFEEEEETS